MGPTLRMSSTPTGVPAPRAPATGAFADGLAAGLVGYAAVVVAVAAMDWLGARELFHTPAALGSWLFFGAGDPGAVDVWAGPVLAYNGVHLVASLAVATAAAFLVAGAGRLQGFWYAGLLVLVLVIVGAVAALGALAVETARAVDWPTVVVGTAAWLGSMSAWFWWAHPRLLRDLADAVEGEG